LSLRIPTDHKFDRTACEDIEKLARDYYENQGIARALLEVLQPALGEQRLPIIMPKQEHIMTVLARKMTPLREAGLIEIIQEEDDKEKIQAYSPEDQTRYRKIQQTSNALNELRDSEAEKLLSELAEKIEAASDGIKARYYNNIGVLHLHKGKFDAAVQAFESAHDLRPREPKYTTNLLLSQLLVASRDKPLAGY
jgi:tetratricopeptide (TPR) repeat protein